MVAFANIQIYFSNARMSYSDQWNAHFEDLQWSWIYLTSEMPFGASSGVCWVRDKKALIEWNLFELKDCSWAPYLRVRGRSNSLTLGVVT
jgi:hypothetical protein